MTSIVHPRRVLGPLSVATVALMLGACSSDKQQMHAIAPVNDDLGRTNVQPPTAQPPNTATASNVVIAPEILRACNIPDTDAYFAFDSAHLTGFDHGPLDQLATCFTSGPMAGRKLALVGHADPRGSADYNITLGQSRADSVADYLSGQGLTRYRMTTTSRGALDAQGHDETGWAHDRRVDVKLGQ